MIEILNDFYLGTEKYIDLFDQFIKKYQLETIARADHICYKCDSKEVFESIRTLFEHESTYIYQSIIAGRRIAYIKLPKGIETSLGTIEYLELSDQKPDGSQENKFDHIEVYPVTISYDEMVRRLSETEKVVKVERPHHTTHDILIADNFLFRCTEGPLIEKIKNTEMK